jgi:hypothetical protein
MMVLGTEALLTRKFYLDSAAVFQETGNECSARLIRDRQPVIRDATGPTLSAGRRPALNLTFSTECAIAFSPWPKCPATAMAIR